MNENPAADDAHHRVSPAGFEFLVTELVCWAVGGPQQYSGRPMGDSRRHRAITEAEWAAFVHDLHVTLAKFQVPPAEETDLVAIVESTRDATVVAPPLR